MNKKNIKLATCWIPVRSWRKRFRSWLKGPRSNASRESALAHQYLDGLCGIEIGASMQNPFGLERTGAYANVDFDFTQGGKWQSSEFAPAIVNVVANGDDLPFKDNCLDYVVSSHVIEHFFDPIKALKEWHRVVRPGGYIFIICPHMDRTFDHDREQTSLDELLKRHSGELPFEAYHMNQNYLSDQENKGDLRGLTREPGGDCEPHRLVLDGEAPSGYVPYESDDHHHWTTWKTESFLAMCEHMGWKVCESHDVDDKVGNGFTVILRV